MYNRSYIDKPVSLGRKFHLIIGEFVTRDHRFANCCLIVLFCSIRWRESKSGCGRDGEKAKASSAWWKVLSFFHLVVCLLKKNKSFFCPVEGFVLFSLFVCLLNKQTHLLPGGRFCPPFICLRPCGNLIFLHA